MEPAFGADFADVRVHTDAAAAESAQGVQALAYTVGNEVVFQSGMYQPETPAGQRMLAHELTHVVQQRRGPVDGTAAGGGVSVSDPSDRFEQAAEASADGFMASGRWRAPTPGASAPGGVVHRKAKGVATDCAGPATQSESPSCGGKRAGASVQRQTPDAAGSVVSGGGCAVINSGADPRFISDDLCLLSDDLAGDEALNNAFHNNPPLTPKNNTPGDPAGPVGKLQQGLLDAGEDLGPKGVDSNWGGATTRAVASFQGKNGIQPGGFEAGRKTLLALDSYLQQHPKPKPPPPPQQQAVLNDPCQQVSGQTATQGTVTVTGAGFPAETTVDLLLDSAKVGALLADKDGNVNGPVAVTASGSHVVEATAGAAHAARQFTMPCGAPPTPDPAVTQSERLVLDEYQYMYETQRDATEDAVKDLLPLDKRKLPLYREIATRVTKASLQFGYGAINQLILGEIFRDTSQDPDWPAIGAAAQGKANDSFFDEVTDAVKDAFKDQDNEPNALLTEHLEVYRRGQLASLRLLNFNNQQKWIPKMQSDPITAKIRPEDVTALGDAIEKQEDNIYQAWYQIVIGGWTAQLSQTQLGVGTAYVEDPEHPKDKEKEIQISVSELWRVEGKEPSDVPGVLIIAIVANDNGQLEADKKLSDAADVPFVMQMVDIGDIHIWGLGEQARKHIVDHAPKIRELKIPTVLRGEPAHGGRVDIGQDEAGRIVDGGSDDKGRRWLADVSKGLGGSGDADDGMQRLFDRDLGRVVLFPGLIQGP